MNLSRHPRHRRMSDLPEMLDPLPPEVPERRAR